MICFVLYQLNANLCHFEHLATIMQHHDLFLASLGPGLREIDD